MVDTNNEALDPAGQAEEPEGQPQQTPLPLYCCCVPENLQPLARQGLKKTGAPFLAVLILGFAVCAVGFASSDDMRLTWIFGILASVCSTHLFCITSFRADTIEHKLDSGFTQINADMDTRFDQMDTRLNTVGRNVDRILEQLQEQRP